MSDRLVTACTTLALAAFGAGACAHARPRPGRADVAAADGYEDCTQGGSIALSVTLSDAATGRGLPWRVAPYTAVEWRAGRTAGTAYDRSNFGPERTYPTEGVADRYTIGVAWGRPGTYGLTVRVPGYQPWDTAGVRVPAVAPAATRFPPYAPAHCATGAEVVVEARLRPAPQSRP